MPEILARQTKLRVYQASDGERLQNNVVYVAPPNVHMLVEGDRIILRETPKVHFLRPSGDLLFQSLASNYKRNAIAVVLSGTGADGSAGVVQIKEQGGTVIIQDEATSAFFGMPSAAIATGCADYVVPLDRISATLNSLVDEGSYEPE